jgi:hypothetical protein
MSWGDTHPDGLLPDWARSGSAMPYDGHNESGPTPSIGLHLTEDVIERFAAALGAYALTTRTAQPQRVDPRVAAEAVLRAVLNR